MKLHRFTAASNQLAMQKVHQAFGAEALIYGTRKVGNETEILAGLPSLDSVNKEEANELELLTKQLRAIESRIVKLASGTEESSPEERERDELYCYLGRLGLRGLFRQRFMNKYLMSNDLVSGLDEARVEDNLLSAIKVDERELIDVQRICALIGPTGVGKTTTILKLAKRYIKKYNAASLGLISTDFHDITAKNQMLYYSEKLGVDFEYANSPYELAESIDKLKDKSLILIDTQGVSQRDPYKVAQLLASQLRYEGPITNYLTLPCNVQERSLADITEVFSAFSLAGCILTKVDESLSLAPAVNACLNKDLSISYLCNGQNLNTDIAAACASEILYEIQSCHDSENKTAEELIDRNTRHVTKMMKESA